MLLGLLLIYIVCNVIIWLYCDFMILLMIVVMLQGVGVDLVIVFDGVVRVVVGDDCWCGGEMNEL